MEKYQLLFLPIFALTLVIFLPILEKNASFSHNLRSRRFRRIILGRITVAVLLISTVVAYLWPTGNLNQLAFGLIITAAMMTPILIAYFIISMQYHKVRHRKTAWLSEDNILRTIEPSDAGQKSG